LGGTSRNVNLITIGFASLQVFQAFAGFCGYYDSLDHGGGNSGESSDDCGAHKVPTGQKCGGSLHYQVSDVLLFIIRKQRILYLANL
jgi:hypothetical protein